jgi:hypothetical protein
MKTCNYSPSEPGQFVGAALLRNLAISFLVIAQSGYAANVLTNPGVESGNLAGWTTLNSVGPVPTTAHYYNNNTPAGASNILTHTGSWVIQTYNSFAGGAPTLCYQDVAAAAGSVWSANVWGISHWQDYIGNGNVAYLEVIFLDSATNAVGVFGSAVLDPSGFNGIIPPMGTNVSDFMFLPATNAYDHVSAQGNPLGLSSVTNTASTFTAPPGTVRVRYQIEFDGIAFQGGSIFWDDADLEKISGSDPDIATAPAPQTVIVGQNATFAVVGGGNTTLSYQWLKGGTPLSNGGRISGATSASLTISNTILSDAGGYSVVVTDTHGSITSIPVSLTVNDPAAAANSLANHSFESGAYSPWIKFNGGALQTTNNTYFNSSTPVNIQDGNYCAEVYQSGQFNGFFQDVAVAPGTVWKADGYGYMSSSDPLMPSGTTPPDPATNNTECWIEVSFRDGTGGNILSIYKSSVIDSNFATDAWVHLPVSNRFDNFNFTTNIGSGPYMVAPTNAHSVRFQVTYRSLEFGSGAAYWDNLALYRIVPVTVAVSRSAGNINISFATRGASTYQVQYKTNLTDSAWQVLTTITGDGLNHTVTDPTTGTTRFYRVQTL